MALHLGSEFRKDQNNLSRAGDRLEFTSHFDPISEAWWRSCTLWKIVTMTTTFVNYKGSLALEVTVIHLGPEWLEVLLWSTVSGVLQGAKKKKKAAVCSEVSVFRWLKNFSHFNGKGETLHSSVEFLIKEKLQTSSWQELRLESWANWWAVDTGVDLTDNSTLWLPFLRFGPISSTWQRSCRRWKMVTMTIPH